MAELHSLPNHCKTFGDIARVYMENLLMCTVKANVVVDVFDQYDNDNSVKAEERGDWHQ